MIPSVTCGDFGRTDRDEERTPTPSASLSGTSECADSGFWREPGVGVLPNTCSLYLLRPSKRYALAGLDLLDRLLAEPFVAFAIQVSNGCSRVAVPLKPFYLVGLGPAVRYGT